MILSHLRSTRIIKEMLTFVTSFHSVRSGLDSYIDQFDKLAKTGVPILLFVESNCKYTFSYPNVKVIQTDFDTSLATNDIVLPANRNMEKDTAIFLCLMASKLRWMSEALLYTNTSHLAWIDFRIFHVVKNTEIAQEKLRALTSRSFTGLTKILSAGCWDPTPDFDILNSICWRFCGGFLLGPRAIFPRAYVRQTELVHSFLPHLTWEVNYWSRMEDFFEWYPGSHDDTILMNVPYSPRIIRPGRQVHYVDGGKFRRVHIGNAVELSIFKALCETTEDGIMVMPKTDMLVESNEYRRMKSTISWNDPAISDIGKLSVPKGSILCLDTSRMIDTSSVLHYPLDDDTLRNGLQMEEHQPDWSSRKPVVIWRGGSSCVERPSVRMRVVEALHNAPHADVKFVRGGWPQNDAEIPDIFYGNRISHAEHSNYKYMLSIDGNGAASSAQWIFASGCVPLFVTHPKQHFWLKEFMIPMVNYVPISYDLSDLTEKIQWLVDHDEEALQISINAREFHKTVLSSKFQADYIRHAMVKLTHTLSNANMDPEYSEPAGKQHYRFLEDMSMKFSNSVLFDIGTHKGMSAYALSTNPTNTVLSFDIEEKSGRPIRPNVHYKIEDVLMGPGRELWKETLLASPLIFLDIDPHEGTREYDFYVWLRDNNYKGTLICDDIWYFKEMRDNFWYKIPSEHKIDVTERGHMSGTGIIRFEPPVPHVESNWTVVTAYFDLTKMKDASPSIIARPNTHYLASANSTMSLDQNLVVFCEPETVDILKAMRPEHLSSKTRYIPMSFEDFTLTKYRDRILDNRVHRPSPDNRNTASYYLLCMARYAMLKKVIEENPFQSTHFAWLNICIERMGWKNLTQLNRVFELNRDKFSTCYIDYQPRESYLENTMAQGRCSMCSGFFTGNAYYMKEFCDRIEAKFIECLEKGYGHADEQLYSLVYFDNPSLFDVYYGDYTEMITNYEWVREHARKPLYLLIKHSFEAGDLSTCLTACRALWSSFKKGYAELSETETVHLIWYYRKSLEGLRLPVELE